ncbi:MULTISPECIES: bis(5'-nucleosyl)-tetraphosphatase (symmetrical) YqeK [Sporosarcina]|uniref:bis(5'-nucleosyl)-tetraphosphatase (symmetrical) YqeK n=1 Tax=Sporosarcina TaxID=1569 RepID=UPI00058B4D06|nr:MULTISPECIES: bis(5'-nucleosyl)-tetraphosphatase (symmetrical) YqeK [Sporosarcina]WJY28527.1 bis(5'-nucleosyl)-tetraphosphatase (symmetrical) YqeK [Sporosarcina sp. 0.2-SM1T-5]
MEPAQLIEELKSRLSIQRFQHVLRVTETAKALAMLNGVPVEKAEAAALFHDIAKNMDAESLQDLLVSHGAGGEVLGYNKELWHAPAGAIIAEEQFGIADSDILNAIRFHTTGRPDMSPLEMVIYVADMTEPARDFPGADGLRLKAEGPVRDAMKECIIHSVEHLISKRVPVHPDSIRCYNYFVK